jgi:hypothetical protein
MQVLRPKKNLVEGNSASEDRSLKMAKPPITKKRKRGDPNQMTGLIGVYTFGKEFNALIHYGGTTHYLGTFDTQEQAGIAYDRAAIDKSTEEVSYTLNYPKLSDHEREEAMKVEPPKKRKKKKKKKTTGTGNPKKTTGTKKQKRGNPNKRTGLIGVYKRGHIYVAQIWFGGTDHYLGRFKTKEEAGVAYDRFVVDKSTEKVSFTLNYPNGLPTRDKLRPYSLLPTSGTNNSSSSKSSSSSSSSSKSSKSSKSSSSSSSKSSSSSSSSSSSVSVSSFPAKVSNASGPPSSSSSSSSQHPSISEYMRVLKQKKIVEQRRKRHLKRRREEDGPNNPPPKKQETEDP